MEPGAFLQALFDAALVLPAQLPEPPRGRTVVVGAGKASAAMGLALERHWPGERLGDQVITGPTLTNFNDFRAVPVLPP